jgi:hypothetical protein
MRRSLPFSRLLVLLALFGCLLSTVKAQGGAPGLVLGMSRDFGYGGFGEVQGAMRLKVSGPSDLQRVVFLLDDEVMGEATVAPWQLAFHTDSFAPGKHSMTAVGYTSGGLTLQSNEISTRFLSATEAGGATSRLVVSLLGGIGALMLLSFGLTTFLSRGRKAATAPGSPRSYGLAGGAICPGCHRPYARHYLAPNMILGKLERCPHCGKWAVVAARSPAELAAAEAAELAQANSQNALDAAEGADRMAQDLEDSRFDHR